MNRQSETFFLAGPVGDLESCLTYPINDKENISCIVIICHPHPLHGGTMDNKVVTTVSRAVVEMGMLSVRFNFRGVGASYGNYDDGQGEVDDLKYVIKWCQDEYPDVPILLAGFSFGSFIAWSAMFQRIVEPAALLMVAPPINRFSYAQFQSTCPLIVVQGKQDDIVDAVVVKNWFDKQKLEHKCFISMQTGHFFHGQLVALKEHLTSTIAELL